MDFIRPFAGFCHDSKATPIRSVPLLGTSRYDIGGGEVATFRDPTVRPNHITSQISSDVSKISIFKKEVGSVQHLNLLFEDCFTDFLKFCFDFVRGLDRDFQLIFGFEYHVKNIDFLKRGWIGSAPQYFI